MNLTEWFREQSEYNKKFYERLHANRHDLSDWKVILLFYSALHRVNYWFDTRTGRVPDNHAEGNRRVRNELPQVRNEYGNLYAMSRRARYCDGFRIGDARRRLAARMSDRIEIELPFP